MAKKKTVKATNKANATKQKAATAKKANKLQQAEDAAGKEYETKLSSWEAIARKVFMGDKGVKKDIANKVLVARGLMELAGGYEEAIILLDAVMIVAASLENK